MLFYHVTKNENVQSILEKGLFPSIQGLDGPGVYLWRGPLANAISEADSSLSDNHFEMSNSEYAEFKRNLDVIAVKLPSSFIFSVEWPEYVVCRDNIPANYVTYIGTFYDLVESCCEVSHEPLSEQIKSASVRAVDSHYKAPAKGIASER